MERKQIMEMFDRKNRIGALATANTDGAVNAAVFGSPRMIDEDTVIMAIGNNRSYQYLRNNPRATFIVIEPGDAPMTWKGSASISKWMPWSVMVSLWIPFERTSASLPAISPNWIHLRPPEQPVPGIGHGVPPLRPRSRTAPASTSSRPGRQLRSNPHPPFQPDQRSL